MKSGQNTGYDPSGTHMWNLQTGKLEMSNMRAMEYNRRCNGQDISQSPTTNSFWIEVVDGKEKRKALISTYFDKTIRLFL